MEKVTLNLKNVFSFVNLPESKATDVNMKTFFEIMSKFNSVKINNKEFLPYNKSIFTRIIYEQAKK